MPGWLRTFCTILVLGLIFGVPTAYAVWRENKYRNFHVVNDGVLYRSGQLTPEGLRRVVHDHGIKTIVTLRYADDPAGEPKDAWEEKWAKSKNLYYHRFRHCSYERDDKGVAPIDANVTGFLEIMADPKHYPVLVHCFAGVHRTGAMVAMYRMEMQSWPAKKALEEMRHHGYTVNHQDVFEYVLDYRRKGIAVKSDATPVSLMP